MASPKTVLLADRARNVRMLLRKDLERDGRFRLVGEAGTPWEAIELSACLQPDAVVLDLDGAQSEERGAHEMIRRAAPRSVLLSSAAVSSSPLGPGRTTYAASG